MPIPRKELVPGSEDVPSSDGIGYLFASQKLGSVFGGDGLSIDRRLHTFSSRVDGRINGPRPEPLRQPGVFK